MAFPVITLPGIDGSGPGHWQSLWEAADPTIRRFSPTSWSRPELHDWIDALETAVIAARTPPLLVAHSLSCLLVPSWAARSTRQAAGAVLVAPPDPLGPRFPAAADGFRRPPLELAALPCPGHRQRG